MSTWHESKTGNHQGLVIEDETGRNVAVTYDKADAPLVAAAPDLLAALQRSLSWFTSYPGSGPMGKNGPYEQARAAIAKAQP